jgi:nitroreductase
MGASVSQEDEITDIFHAADTFVSNAEWRKAVKQYNRKGPRQAFLEIVNPPHLFGSQPYTVYAVQDDTRKEWIRDMIADQPQLTACHSLFIFCIRTDFVLSNEVLIDSLFEKRSLRYYFWSMFGGPTLPDKIQWATRQTHMGVGYAIAACEYESIPCVSIEGWSAASLSALLRIPSNVTPTAILAIGATD